jgi:16S rRNA pseudouridine516 synthase
MKNQRLDKILAHLGYGSRREIKKLAKEGQISINGVMAKDAGIHVFPAQDVVLVSGEPINYRQFIYLMLNKPAGLISATEDSKAETVLDLLDESEQAFKPFPVGRLDKDTEGLLLLTNDGKLSHQLLSPKKHVPKTYYARVKGEVTVADVANFREGLVLDDGYHTLPGELEIHQGGPISEVELTIYEGKFHQVKRMFQTVGKEVIYLKRIKMGDLALDNSLPLGGYRELTEQELALLHKS